MSLLDKWYPRTLVAWVEPIRRFPTEMGQHGGPYGGDLWPDPPFHALRYADSSGSLDDPRVRLPTNTLAYPGAPVVVGEQDLAPGVPRPPSFRRERSARRWLLSELERFPNTGDGTIHIGYVARVAGENYYPGAGSLDAIIMVYGCVVRKSLVKWDEGLGWGVFSDRCAEGWKPTWW